MSQLLTLNECAEKLSVSRSKVSRLVKAGVLPHIKLGGDWRSAVRVSAEDLEAYIQAHRTDATATS